MTDFLEQMSESSRARAARLGAGMPQRVELPVLPLRRERFDLIAELKDHSPAEGRLSGVGSNRRERALAYAAGGAAAISVLTEPDRFGGSLDHLVEVARVAADARVPVMRKDFLVDPYQVVEARHCGASGVLLIAAILDDDALRVMLDRAFELSMWVLLESFDAADLERSKRLLDDDVYAGHARAGELLIGVNTRDLRTLEVDPERLQRLAPQLPACAVAVAESGLTAPADTARVASLGYRMGLVGTALMRSNDPARLVADMLAAARTGPAA